MVLKFFGFQIRESIEKPIGAHLSSIQLSAVTKKFRNDEQKQNKDSTHIRTKHNKVIIGGPVSQEFCRKIGADGYSPDAAKAVRLVKSLLNLTQTTE
jgi:5-methyltetrahydrofolate--homocysteine methyltransferase